MSLLARASRSTHIQTRRFAERGLSTRLLLCRTAWNLSRPAAILRHQPRTNIVMRSFQLETDQATIRYHDLPGGGTPLLFIHGLGSASSLEFPRIARDPALAGRRTVLIDLLGSGFSDRPA